MSVPSIIIFLGGIVLLAHLFNNLFDKIRIPAVLVLIAVGIVIGPLTGVVLADDFGKTGPVFSNLVLLFILFDSGTKLELKTLKKSMLGATGLTFAMFILTTAVVSLVCHFGLHLSWLPSVMTGSILAGTSSAIVIPMLKPLKISEESKTLLLMESALSDVLCLVTGLALLAAMKDGDFTIGNIFSDVGKSFFFSIGLGLLIGIGWSFVIQRIRQFQNSAFITGSIVLIAYGLTEYLHLNGGIAVLMLGIALGNIETLTSWIPAKVGLHPNPISKAEKKFFGEIVFVFAAFYFVYIGISMQFSSFWTYLIALGITLALFALRFLFTRVYSTKALKDHRNIIASIMPKGLVPAILASQPLQYGLEGGEVIQNTVYAIILCSILFSSLFIVLFSGQKQLNIAEDSAVANTNNK